MANVAVVQGASRGIGLSIARFLLRNSNLQVVSTTSSLDPNQLRQKILDGIPKNGECVPKNDSERHTSRLHSFRLDVRDEVSIEKVSKTVQERFGSQLRLLVNVSGVLLAEKSITKIKKEDMERTFQINTFGHLLTYKHFFPLLPSKTDNDRSQVALKEKGEKDPAEGLIQPSLNVLLSLSAKVGSIADNSLGGWYSYRSSKTAINQIMVTLQRELDLKKSLSPTITVAYHPGTVLGTQLSEQFVEPKQPAKLGVHPPDQAVERLFKVLNTLTAKDGASFLDYQAQRLPW